MSPIALSSGGVLLISFFFDVQFLSCLFICNLLLELITTKSTDNKNDEGFAIVNWSADGTEFDWG